MSRPPSTLFGVIIESWNGIVGDSDLGRFHLCPENQIQSQVQHVVPQPRGYILALSAHSSVRHNPVAAFSLCLLTHSSVRHNPVATSQPRAYILALSAHSSACPLPPTFVQLSAA
jgi:hypothetical protein